MKTFLIFLTIIIASCSNQKISNAHFNRDYQLQAYIWQQRSGEFQALCYQAYNLAKQLLYKDLENKHNKKRAVIFDIDETVFNNSYGGANDVLNDSNWNPKLFDDWAKQSKATAIAGAIDFIKLLKTKKVEAFFITNRNEEELEATILNFKNLGIEVNPRNIRTIKDNWSKEGRRLEIEKEYEVVMLIGDNLDDFHRDFDHLNTEEQKTMTDKHAQDFGEKFIVLPNVLYGDWERGLPKVNDKRELLILR